MLDWFANTFNSFLDIISKLFLSLWHMVKDVFYWLYESFLDLSILILEGTGTAFESLDVAQYFSSIPSETQYILSQIGLTQAMGMIIASIGIRIVLQLIPLTRLGS